MFTRTLALLVPLAAPLLAQDEDSQGFVARHAGADEQLSLQEVRAALAEIELMVVVRRELREADYRLEVLRQRSEQTLELDPSSDDLREAVLLGLVAHVELQLARGFDEDAWNEFPEVPEQAVDTFSTEIAAWRAILTDPRVAELREYVAARREGRAAQAPERSPLVGLRPEHDEIERLVRAAVENGDRAFVFQLGERAAPALAKIVLEDLELMPRGGRDPLQYLAHVHPSTAARFMFEHLEEGGFFWKRRVLLALDYRDIFTKNVWDSSTFPHVCRVPEFVAIIEALVEDPEVGNEALRLAKPICFSGAMSPALQAAMGRALASDDGDRRRIAQQNLFDGAHESILPVLEAAVAATNVEVRRFAARKLLYFPWSDALAARSQDPDVQVRLAVTEMLLSRRVKVLTPSATTISPTTTVVLNAPGRALLDRMLRDPGPDVRSVAVQALKSLPIEEVDLVDPVDGHFMGKRAYWVDPPERALLLAVARDPDERVRTEFARLLGNLQPPLMLELAEVLARDSQRRIAGYALEHLDVHSVGGHGAAALAVLRAYEGNPNTSSARSRHYTRAIEAVRSSEALDALVAWSASAGGEALAALVGDEGGYPRLRAQVDPGTFQVLLAAIDASPDPGRAVELLSGVPPSQDPALAGVAADPQSSARLRAFAVLAGTRFDPDRRAAFLVALRDPWWNEQARQNSHELRLLGRWFGELDAVEQAPLALAAVTDPGVSARCSASLASISELEAPGGVELATAIRARWFDVEDPDGVGYRALLNVLRSVPRLPELRDPAFLAAAIERPWYAEPAAQALGELRDPAYLPLLAKLVREQRGTPAWNTTVTQVLPSFLTDESAELLLQAAAWAEDDSVRASCLASLESMREYFLARDYWSRRQALDRSREAAVAELLVLLGDESEAVRVQAIRGLATFDAVEAIPRLIRLLKDPSPTIKAAASEALEYLNRPGERDPAPGEDG